LLIGKLVLFAGLLGFYAYATAAGVAAKPPSLSAMQLKAFLPKLQKGGYVFYFRHAATDMFQLDDHPTLGDCTTQRPLSDEGREQARTIGKAFRKQKIPVGLVLSSPFCRCVETAQLAFGKATVDDSLFFATRLSAAERKANAEKLRKNIAKRPDTGSNTVIVAHNANMMEAYGIWPNEEGDALIFKPDGDSPGQPVAEVPVGLWRGLSK